MSNDLEYLPIPFSKDNYAWVIADGISAVVVDPGVAEPVVAYIHSRKLIVTAILLTHHHGDHVGGVEELLRFCGKKETPVFGPARERIASVTCKVGDGFEVTLQEPAFSAKVIATPGHTNGHVTYYQQGVAGLPGHLFSGDTLFASGCGRLLEGTAAEMLGSLDTLASLPPATLVHCAHEYTLSNLEFARVCEPGNKHVQGWQDVAVKLRERGRPTLPTTIAHELSVNPFLRVHEPAIHDVLVERFNVPVPHRLAAFILLRAWKDLFQGEFRELTEKWVELAGAGKPTISAQIGP
ncbi:hydroxyacylglutathione hydrolase [Paraburkholderia rhynchosiae]|nr:hydroxyacylglutathione hydrolase [Paraburkholderia rhynchosiae]PMS30394.1 hydroxyacylglutathione hydrolase [Paraburkholderia rhynchosiae]